eukprot:3941939-Rhodomonas_salina.3
MLSGCGVEWRWDRDAWSVERHWQLLAREDPCASVAPCTMMSSSDDQGACPCCQAAPRFRPPPPLRCARSAAAHIVFAPV